MKASPKDTSATVMAAAMMKQNSKPICQPLSHASAPCITTAKHVKAIAQAHRDGAKEDAGHRMKNR
jgi:hypothetical protein